MIYNRRWFNYTIYLPNPYYPTVSPSLIARPDDKIIIEGATVTFHCNATGNPAPNMTWTKDGKTITTGETLSFVTDRNQSGQYWCSADNGLNATVNASATLDVQCEYHSTEYIIFILFLDYKLLR